jgi:hypothetical protein
MIEGTRLYPALDFLIEFLCDRTQVVGREAFERHAKTASLRKEHRPGGQLWRGFERHDSGW